MLVSGDDAAEKTPAPDTTVHVPVFGRNVLVNVLKVPPVVRVLAASVAVEAHPTVWLAPAMGVVGHDAHPFGHASQTSPTLSESASA
jgi:hypothetical protein